MSGIERASEIRVARMGMLTVAFLLILVLVALIGSGTTEAASVWWKSAEQSSALDRRDITPGANTASRTKWDEGYIEVMAGATADMRTVVNRAQGRSMALRTARHLAYEKLAETVEGLSLDGERTFQNEISRDSTLRIRVQAAVRGARVVSETVDKLPDGSVWAEVVVGLALAGRGGVSGTLGGWAPTPAPNGQYRPNPAFTTEDQYTGLIVDASGLGFIPALMPRLLVADEGTQVFGPSEVERQAIESRGVVAYRESLQVARTDLRVGANPLVIRAIAAAGDRRGDLLVSRRDAERIRALNRQSRALQEAAAIIVVGKATADLVKDGAGRRHALVVGVGEFSPTGGGTAVPPLRFAGEDARGVGSFLARRGGFATTDVTLLVDQQANRQAIYAALRGLRATVREEDVVLIYFSGHGTVGTGADGTAHFYLVPHDVRLSDLAHTAIRDDVFEELVAQLPSRQVLVLLDACHSGGVGGKRVKSVTATGGGALPSGKIFIEAGEGRVILSASRPDQPSIEDESLGHGVFTHFLLEALAGKADHDQDGRVTVLEAYQYTSGAVRGYTQRTHGFEQTPVLDVRGMSGEILVTATGDQTVR